MTQTTAPHVGINGQLLSGAHSYRSAGVSGYIRQLLAHLPAAAPDLRLTAFTPDVDLDPAPNLQQRRSTRWDTRRPLRRILWEQAALPQLARQARLDLLHGAVNVSPAIAPCPSVVTVHDLSFMRYPQAFPPMQRAYLHSQVRRSVAAARRVIAVSEATKQDLIGLFGASPERIDVVYNGVDASFCPAPAAEVEAFRARAGLPARFILHLGTLEPRKNLVRLVQAFAQVRGQDAGQPAVKLVLAGGKGWDYDAIFNEVTRQGLEREVLFPGYVAEEELAWWYRAATLFVYPSLLEGFGLPVLEAMACGAPVVTSNLSSLPEVAGDAALLVDPASVDALAAALLRLLVDAELASRLRGRGLAQAARFPWSRTAAQTAAVYRRALPRAAGGAL
ncbi:MAG TPA: glycosyltransferase family 1 protein [Anaerolineae bacterium]|nr:glycosyltransferase family 1 protein [Anaerolineae bacterium]HNU05133.1 glycosyltransferase family 1 protein [Anaerolineae bacterium]